LGGSVSIRWCMWLLGGACGRRGVRFTLVGLDLLALVPESLSLGWIHLC
jgi:hypothetical protein